MWRMTITRSYNSFTCPIYSFTFSYPIYSSSLTRCYRSFPDKRFPNKLAPNVPNNILKNPPFCSFTSFWAVSATPFKNKPESSGDFIILVTSSFSLFYIISVVVLLWPDPNIFLCIPASAADAAAVNPKGIKTLLANGLITFLLMVILFLVMQQVTYQEILLIVSSLIIGFLIT